MLDASVAAAWVLPRQATPASEALLDAAQDSEFVTPRFFLYELRRIVLKAERTGVLTEGEADDFLDEVWTLPILVEPDLSEDDLARIHNLARATRLSFYDAIYLDVGLRSGLPVASGDRALLTAALEQGVGVLDVRSET